MEPISVYNLTGAAETEILQYTILDLQRDLRYKIKFNLQPILIYRTKHGI